MIDMHLARVAAHTFIFSAVLFYAWSSETGHAAVEEFVPEFTLQGTWGSTVGPGGDLFVTEGALGRISRIDSRTGAITPFADGLPPSIIGIGGAVDVAFIGSKVYALVGLVGDPLFGSPSIDGIYQLDEGGTWSVLADLGAYSVANPPDTNGAWDYFLVNGVPYAMEVYRGGFLVTDGHHNRVLHVTVDGEISEFLTFGNIVPTGLAVTGETVYMAQAGATPHLPDDGRVVSFGPRSIVVTEVARGAPLAVDVEFGRGRTLFTLAQGEWSGTAEGDPADPNTGSLQRVNADGTVSVVEDQLNIPTSMEIIRNDAYVVTLTGGVYRIPNIADAPFGRSKAQ